LWSGKNLLLWRVYPLVASAPVIDFREWGLESLEEMHIHHACTKVFVNGVWKGVHRDPANLVKTIKKLRRKDDISPEVSVVRDIRRRAAVVHRCWTSLSAAVHSENQHCVAKKHHQVVESGL